MKVKSSQPRKQRKFLYTAPLHIRRKFLSAHLSKELRLQYKRRALPIRKGDEIEVMSGEHVGKTGKVARVDFKKYKVYIEGVTTKRTVGTDVQVPIHPSKLKIINLNLDDEYRRKILRGKVKEVKIEKQKTEEKHGKDEKIVGTKVLESAKESKEMGSGTKTRTA